MTNKEILQKAMERAGIKPASVVTEGMIVELSDGTSQKAVKNANGELEWVVVNG